MNINPLLMIDGYKADHRRQYPNGTEVVFSNLTPRKSRLECVDFCVFFGLQYFLKEYLIKRFEDDFFSLPRDYVLAQYKKRLDNYLGGDFSVEHIGELWDLGYLPLEVRAVPEGTKVPIGVPCFTIRNTDPRFFWLTNQLETILSCSVWQACTSATIAHMYRTEFEKSAERTGLEKWFVDFQGHDFSFRGMSSFESACLSGAAHLLSFKGTDTIPAIDFIEQYYRGDGTEGCSVAASEHSVATLNIGSIGGDLLGAERRSILRLITEVYPTGIFSYVADSYDFWAVVTEILPTIKNEIMARNGTLVIRPDTGTPELIICGDPNAPEGSPEYKGAFQCLWETFGGTINDKGFKVLDSHVGLIYGDSITRERQKLILQGLEAKGFAPSVVLGIGSYCVAPETPILCSDLVWRKAGEISVGQEIIAFDEDPKFADDRRAARRYKTAKITHNTPCKKECSKIGTDIGPLVTASNDHPWLVYTKNRTPKNTFFNKEMTKEDRKKLSRTSGLCWKRTSELKIGDKIAFFSNPWEVSQTREAGWLEGIFDGEGSISKSTGDFRLPAWKVNISQNPGQILNRIRSQIEDLGFTYYMNVRDCPQVVLSGGFSEVLRFLGIVKPTRLLEKLPRITSNMPALIKNRTYKLATIKSIEDVGVSDVSSITTSCGTFITGGYLSHNTYQHNTRDTLGFAVKSTWGQVDGKPCEIFKAPKTDKGGEKKSAKGYLTTVKVGDTISLVDRMEPFAEHPDDLMRTVYLDGSLVVDQKFSEIKARLNED